MFFNDWYIWPQLLKNVLHHYANWELNTETNQCSLVIFDEDCAIHNLFSIIAATTHRNQGKECETGCFQSSKHEDDGENNLPELAQATLRLIFILVFGSKALNNYYVS